MLKPLSRRTALKGAAATIALPMLNAMQPLSSLASTAAATVAPPKRLAFMYIPNGVIMQHWFPQQGQTDWLESQSLKPLQAVRDDIVVINGLIKQFSRHALVHPVTKVSLYTRPCQDLTLE